MNRQTSGGRSERNGELQGEYKDTWRRDSMNGKERKGQGKERRRKKGKERKRKDKKAKRKETRVR